jgi:hypothetical protein
VAHDLRLAFDGRTAIVRARVRHSRVKVTGDAVAYLSGLEFVDLTDDARGLIASILDRAAGAPEAGDTI